PGGASARTAVLTPAPPLRPTQKAPAKGGVHVGMALTTHEIRGILEHAGAGCPLGPCPGCPHNDVRSGACTA
ncbi:MAG: hypothetical protein AB1726_05110, partial [Planctomycetota bacterium]